MPKSRKGPIRVGDLTPEIIPAMIVERDGEEVELRGYVDGRCCPGRIKARMASIGRRYSEATQATLPDGSTEFRHDPEAYRLYLRDAIDACVIGLEDTEADVLAGDEDRVNSVLRYLEWLPDEADDTDAEGDENPEANGERSTSESYSPNSPTSTDSDQPSS